MAHDDRLSPHFVWLFAVIAVLGGLGLSFLTAEHGWKVSAVVFFGFVGVMAFFGGFFTRASALQAIGPFVIAAGALGAVHYVIVKSVLTAAADSVGLGHGAGITAGAMGAVAAVVITIDALVASVGGALFGVKMRSVTTPAALLRRPA